MTDPPATFRQFMWELELARDWIGDAVSLLFDLSAGTDLTHPKKLQIVRDLLDRYPEIGPPPAETEQP